MSEAKETRTAAAQGIAELIGRTVEEQTSTAEESGSRTARPEPDELWHRDGAMVYIIEGPGEDDSHFVADAASDDDAERFVDWHNQALASLAARLPAAREQAATEADLRLLVMTTARDAAVVEADRLREAATEARRELLAKVEGLANEAARAVTEPRRFHENEDNRQQALSQAVAAVRLTSDAVPLNGDPDAWAMVAEDLASAVTGSKPTEFRRGSVAAKHYAAAAIRRRLIEESVTP